MLNNDTFETTYYTYWPRPLHFASAGINSDMLLLFVAERLALLARFFVPPNMKYLFFSYARSFPATYRHRSSSFAGVFRSIATHFVTAPIGCYYLPLFESRRHWLTRQEACLAYQHVCGRQRACPDAVQRTSHCLTTVYTSNHSSVVNGNASKPLDQACSFSSVNLAQREFTTICVFYFMGEFWVGYP